MEVLAPPSTPYTGPKSNHLPRENPLHWYVNIDCWYLTLRRGRKCPLLSRRTLLLLVNRSMSTRLAVCAAQGKLFAFVPPLRLLIVRICRKMARFVMNVNSVRYLTNSACLIPMNRMSFLIISQKRHGSRQKKRAPYFKRDIIRRLLLMRRIRPLW